MSLNRLFDTIEQARETARWQAAFGEPQAVEGRTIVPVAKVGYGFGFGFGSGTAPPEEEGEVAPGGEGGGGGGQASAKPLGALVVTPEDVYFEETTDEGKVALAGIALSIVAVLQFFKTLRVIFGK